MVFSGAEGYHYMNEIPFDNNVYDPNSPVEEYIQEKTQYQNRLSQLPIVS